VHPIMRETRSVASSLARGKRITATQRSQTASAKAPHAADAAPPVQGAEIGNRHRLSGHLPPRPPAPERRAAGGRRPTVLTWRETDPDGPPLPLHFPFPLAAASLPEGCPANHTQQSPRAAGRIGRPSGQFSDGCGPERAAGGSDFGTPALVVPYFFCSLFQKQA